MAGGENLPVTPVASLSLRTAEVAGVRVLEEKPCGIADISPPVCRAGATADAAKGEKRTPRSIRFHDPEWERIEAFAEARGVSAAGFVRFAALAAVEDGATAGGVEGLLAPLVERTFRDAHVVATKMRAEMLAEGRDDELETLIGDARALQNELLGRAPD